MPVLVHVAENETVAQIVRDVLNQHGIEARVCRNGWRDPVTEATWIGAEGIRECEIWIADERDSDRAKAIVKEFGEESSASSETGWLCRKCGQMVEGQFTECWQCGASPRD